RRAPTAEPDDNEQLIIPLLWRSFETKLLQSSCSPFGLPGRMLVDQLIENIGPLLESYPPGKVAEVIHFLIQAIRKAEGKDRRTELNGLAALTHLVRHLKKVWTMTNHHFISHRIQLIKIDG